MDIYEQMYRNAASQEERDEIREEHAKAHGRHLVILKGPEFKHACLWERPAQRILAREKARKSRFF